jgi:hypothetical protein
MISSAEHPGFLDDPAPQYAVRLEECLDRFRSTGPALVTQRRQPSVSTVVTSVFLFKMISVGVLAGTNKPSLHHRCKSAFELVTGAHWRGNQLKAKSRNSGYQFLQENYALGLAPLAESGTENFFAKTSFTQRLPPLWAEPFLDRFLSEGA